MSSFAKHIVRKWKCCVAILLLSFAIETKAQLTFTAGYSYLHNKDLDKVFQLYNTARPWQSNTLKPLTNGGELSLGYNICLSKKRQLHTVPQLSYGYSFTAAKNNDFRLTSGLHRAEASAQFRFHPRALLKGISNSGPLGPRWFMTITPGYALLWSFVRRDGETMEDDGKIYRPKSLVFSASAGLGHHLVMLKDRLIITPEIAATWFPYIELDDYAAAVNGHNIVGLNNTFENVFFFQAKLRFTFIKKETNWWNTPVRGS